MGKHKQKGGGGNDGVTPSPLSPSLLLAQDVGHLVPLGLAPLVGAQLALGELEGALLAAGLKEGKAEGEGEVNACCSSALTHTHTHT